MLKVYRCGLFLIDHLSIHVPLPISEYYKCLSIMSLTSTKLTLINDGKYNFTWTSLAGFQSISYNISLDAPIRFKPTPPALLLNKNTTTVKKQKTHNGSIHSKIYNQNFDCLVIHIIMELLQAETKRVSNATQTHTLKSLQTLLNPH